MQRRLQTRVTATSAAIVLAIAAFGFLMPYAGHGIDAATPTGTAQPQVQATATQTPRPTRTPAPTVTPVAILTPLPSLDDLRYYTPVAEAPTESPAPPALLEHPSATSVPPRAPSAQNQPPRAPMRATQTEPGATATPELTAEAAIMEPVVEATRKPSAPLPAATARSTRLPPAPVSNARPPIDLTPAGVAGGGPGTTRTPITNNALIVVAIGLLATGGSWGFYYLLREHD